MTITIAATALAASTDEAAWHEARAEGVTASEVHAIASGGRSTWRRILDEKLNGSTFRGNRHTARGKEREAFILAEVAAMPAVEVLVPNATLYAHAKHELHRATPDALLVEVDGVIAGVEVKSRKHGWNTLQVPDEAFDQMQWGMHVTGLDRWYFVTEVMGEDGEPTLDDPTVILIARDARRIKELVRAAEEFLAWREEGALDDTLPAEQLDVIARWNAAKSRIGAATEEAKALEKQVRSIIAARPGTETDGWKFANESAGGFTYSVTTAEQLDEAAWQDADPDGYAEIQRMRRSIAEAEKLAAATHKRPKITTRLLPVAPKGPAR